MNQKEYTFPEDRQSEVNSRTDADLQSRYQQAFESLQKILPITSIEPNKI